MPKNITSRTLSIADRIIKFILENPNTHIRAIARELNLHPQVVKRCVDRIRDFLEFTSFKNFNAHVANLPILIKLKNGCTPQEILNFLKSGKSSLKKKITLPTQKNVLNSIQNSNFPFKADKKTQILRIVKFLEENPNVHLREIARALNLNPAIVHRCLKEINDFIITQSVVRGIESDSFPNLPIIIRLKEGITSSGVLRFLKIKEKIEKFRK